MIHLAISSSGFASILILSFLSRLGVPCAAAEAGSGFQSLFNGRNLDGWVLVNQRGPGYVVENGELICPADGGGNLLTEKEFSDFVLRFEFKLSEGANNGVAIRAPLQGDAAYLGMEIQILDNHAKKWANLRPVQYHGSIYDLAPARRGALRKAGEWNEQEITCVGREIQVTLNGQRILETNLNSVTDSVLLQKHPGLLRQRGRVGFLGHNSFVAFRNIQIREVAQERSGPPPGFTALFNGRDLTGWRGLADPAKWAGLPAEAAAQGEGNERMRDNWRVEDGKLVYHGKGFDNLATVDDYGDFELWVDWKIEPGGDSGIYLRGVPQVQIWDHPKEGSGGLWNNKKNPSKPMTVADNAPGEWNRFQILMTGAKVTVILNDELVAHNVTLENYWERHKPVYAVGPIELQAHEHPVSFKNIFFREIARTSP